MKPLTDNQIWGYEDEAEPYECPLLEDGLCPEGCMECKKFELEMDPASSMTMPRQEGIE